MKKPLLSEADDDMYISSQIHRLVQHEDIISNMMSVNSQIYKNKSVPMIYDRKQKIFF